jgi:hypothetical protein
MGSVFRSAVVLCAVLLAAASTAAVAEEVPSRRTGKHRRAEGQTVLDADGVTGNADELVAAGVAAERGALEHGARIAVDALTGAAAGAAAADGERGSQEQRSSAVVGVPPLPAETWVMFTTAAPFAGGGVMAAVSISRKARPGSGVSGSGQAAAPLSHPSLLHICRCCRHTCTT